jgi:hypothetical protein
MHYVYNTTRARRMNSPGTTLRRMLLTLALALALGISPVAANTETFLLNVGHVHGDVDVDVDVSLNGFHKVNEGYVYPLTLALDNSSIGAVEIFHVDILSNGTDSARLLLDTAQIPPASYFTRVCWSALYPVSIDISTIYHANTDKDRFLVIDITGDYYGTDGKAIDSLLSNVPIQVTLLDTSSMMYGGDIFWMTLYVTLTAIVGALIAFKIV